MTPDTGPAPPARRLRATVPPVDPMRFAPSAARPVRLKVRHLEADVRIAPHSHGWAQVALSMTGVIRTNAGDSTYLVPPSRALWIPAGVEHVVTVVEAAEIRTLYVHQPAGVVGPATTAGAPPDGDWSRCRVLEVSGLLREAVHQLPADSAVPVDERERLLAALVLDELRRAPALPLGVALPRDKRLRSLCEAVLDDPARWPTLEDWARQVGASPRTVARLFRDELGTTYGQWRQQAVIARALTLAARRLPMATIAADLGYASASAFSAMVRRSVGAPPSRFFCHGAPGSGG